MVYNFEGIYEDIKSNNYKLIGSGSSRKVYDLEDGYVVKCAKDIRGIQQNKNEHFVFNCCKSGIFAQVTDVSEDYRFLVMQKAEIIKSLSKVLSYYHVKNFHSLLKVNHLEDDIKNNNLGKGDLKRPSSWGYVDGVPLIIDYGLTRNIYKKYYHMGFLKHYKNL